MNPIEATVVSCTELHTDGIRNASPTNVEIKGDTRSFTPEVQSFLKTNMKKICERICDMYEAECYFEYTHEFSPTVNWDKCTEIAIKAARNIVGDENVDANCDPMMVVSEDFAKFLEKIPGCFAFIGSRNSDDKNEIIPLHNSFYDYNDSILETGAEFFAEIIKLDYLYRN